MVDANTDLLATIAYLRRQMPRNLDVLKVCGALERRLYSVAEELGRSVTGLSQPACHATEQPAKGQRRATCPVCEARKAAAAARQRKRRALVGAITPANVHGETKW